MLYDEQLLVDYIKAETGYACSLATPMQSDQRDTKQAVTRVTVSHERLITKINSEDDLISSHYDDVNRLRILLTQVNLTCSRKDMASIGNTLQAAIENFTPYVGNSEWGTMKLREASIVSYQATEVVISYTFSIIVPQIV